MLLISLKINTSVTQTDKTSVFAFCFSQVNHCQNLKRSLCYSNRSDTILPEQKQSVLLNRSGQTQYYQNRNSLCYSNRSDTILPEQETVCVTQTGQVRHNTTRTETVCVTHTGQTQYYQNRNSLCYSYRSNTILPEQKQSVLLIQVGHNTTRTETVCVKQETVCCTTDNK